MSLGEWALNALLEAFPELNPTPAQVGLIESAVKTEVDAVAWNETLTTYIGNFDPDMPNSYNPRKIGTMLSVFRDRKQKLASEAKQYEQRRMENRGRSSSIERIAHQRNLLDQYPSENDG